MDTICFATNKIIISLCKSFGNQILNYILQHNYILITLTRARVVVSAPTAPTGLSHLRPGGGGGGEQMITPANSKAKTGRKAREKRVRLLSASTFEGIFFAQVNAEVTRGHQRLISLAKCRHGYDSGSNHESTQNQRIKCFSLES